MRAILINPGDRTISETDVDGSLETLQHIVGGLIEPVHQGLDEHHHCYVNEEGLLDDPRYFFMFEGGHQPLAGTGIILSLTDDGDEAPCTLPLAWVEERVRFMHLAAVRRWARDHDRQR
jgi:hypothetical protein